MMIGTKDDVKLTRTFVFDVALMRRVFGHHSGAQQDKSEAGEVLKLSRNRACSACWKLDFASGYSSIHLKGDVWLEEEFIFRCQWFQLLYW